MESAIKWFTVVVLVVAVIVIFRQRKKSPANREFGSTQELIEFLANSAVDDAAKNNNVRLDYSEDSIRRVDEILENIHQQYLKDNSSVSVVGLSAAYGAYIGEVIRRKEPGAKWERDHPVAGAKSYPLHWGGVESFPMGWCQKRIMNGKEDNVWLKYQILVKERGGSILNP